MDRLVEKYKFMSKYYTHSYFRKMKTNFEKEKLPYDTREALYRRLADSSIIASDVTDRMIGHAIVESSKKSMDEKLRAAIKKIEDKESNKSADNNIENVVKYEEEFKKRNSENVKKETYVKYYRHNFYLSDYYVFEMNMTKIRLKKTQIELNNEKKMFSTKNIELQMQIREIKEKSIKEMDSLILEFQKKILCLYKYPHLNRKLNYNRTSEMINRVDSSLMSSDRDLLVKMLRTDIPSKNNERIINRKEHKDYFVIESLEERMANIKTMILSGGATDREQVESYIKQFKDQFKDKFYLSDYYTFQKIFNMKIYQNRHYLNQKLDFVYGIKEYATAQNKLNKDYSILREQLIFLEENPHLNRKLDPKILETMDSKFILAILKDSGKIHNQNQIDVKNLHVEKIFKKKQHIAKVIHVEKNYSSSNKQKKINHQDILRNSL